MENHVIPVKCCLIPYANLILCFKETYIVCSDLVCAHQEQLKVIYQAQIESLEAQVIALRSVYYSNYKDTIHFLYLLFISTSL